jgi:hypothetical protein
MNTRETRPVKISFPFRLYFEQLFSHDTYVRFINPFSFWRQYRIKHLESCRELNTVQYLESCHQLEWQSWKLPHSGINENSLKISTLSTSFEQKTSNTIFVLQPTIELKYRGVTYRTRKIVSVNISSVQVEPGLLKPNNFARPANYNNTNTPEIYGGNQ